MHKLYAGKPGTFWVDEYEVNPEGLWLRKASREINLEPKIMRILIELAERPGEMVSRQTLLENVWTDSYPSDESLTRAISILRKAFNDGNGRRTIIETVPRRGYRLIANVSNSQPAPALHSENPTPQSDRLHEKIKTPNNFLFLSLLATILVFGFLVLQNLNLMNSKTPDRSIAVLPFVSLSVEPRDTLLAEGLAEELLNTLAGLDELKVAARTSSFVYKANTADVRDIGDALGVAYVLEGSIRRIDNRMRVTAQLISTSDGYNYWSRTFDRPIESIFSIQDEIAHEIANTLEIESVDDSRMFDAGTTNTEAFTTYLEARSYLDRRGLGLSMAISLFENAVELDPEYARAFAGLATAHVVSHIYLDVPKVISQQRAETYAKQALSIDPTLSEPFAVMGVIEADNNNWEKAIEYYRKGEVRDPENVVVLQWHAEALTYLGYIDLAEEKILRAIDINPDSAVLYLVAGLIAQNKDDLQATDFRYKKAVNLGLSDGINGVTYVEFRRGNIEKAANMMALATFNKQYVGEDEVDALEEFFLGIMSHRLKVEDGIEDFPVLAADDDILVPAYMMSGESEKALKLLEADPDGDHDSLFLLWTETDPDLRKHPYFKTFAKNIGMYDYWVKNGWPDKCRAAKDSDYECS